MQGAKNPSFALSLTFFDKAWKKTLVDKKLSKNGNHICGNRAEGLYCGCAVICPEAETAFEQQRRFTQQLTFEELKL